MDIKIKEYLKNEYEKVKDLPGEERNEILIKKVKHKFNEIITGDNIYDICIRISKMKEKIKEINDSVDDNKKYEVIDGHYILHRKDEAPFRFSIEEIDEMFMDFSSKGNNLTGEEMLSKYELKPEAWQCIKHRLRLYKASNVISPYTAENTPDEILDEKIEYAIARHRDTIKGKMVRTYEKQSKEDARKAFKVLGNIDYFLDHLKTYIEGYEPTKVDYIKPKPLNNDRLDIAFSDIHIGKQNTKDIIARFDEIYNFIISRPETNINIICLGDLGESFAPGGMHPGQVEHMEMHGFELMMFIVKTFEKFLIGLDKKGKCVTFRGIGGNHDRIGQNNNQDIQRTAALCIYEMIKRGLSDTEVELEYYIEKINTFRLGVASIQAKGIPTDKIVIQDTNKLVKFLKAIKPEGRGKNKSYPDTYLSYGETVKFTSGNSTLELAKFDGQFPQYSKLIPTQGNHIEIIASEMLQAVKACGGIARDSSSIIKMEFETGYPCGKITLSAHAEGDYYQSDRGDHDTKIECDAIVDTACRIACNSKYLIDVLTQYKDNKVSLQITDASSPLKLESDTRMSVVMPMVAKWEQPLNTCTDLMVV